MGHGSSASLPGMRANLPRWSSTCCPAAAFQQVMFSFLAAAVDMTPLSLPKPGALSLALTYLLQRSNNAVGWLKLLPNLPHCWTTSSH